MLSQEIYDSWNAKTVEDLALLLENIEGPCVPKKKGSSFKKAVLHKIEKRRALETRKPFAGYRDEDQGCCRNEYSCCCRRKSAKLKVFDCKSLPIFEKLCIAATLSFSRSILSTKAVIQKLCYWESVRRGTDGLSVIGGDLWLLSFACQHLIDSPASKCEYSMQAHISDIRGNYQELGQAGEMFLEMVQEFYTDIQQLRHDSLSVMKRLVKKWSFQKEENPLHVRPEDEYKQIPRPRKRLGSGLDSIHDVDDDDDVFSVKWSPLTVTIQLEAAELPRAFGKMHPQDRLTVFRKFMRATIDKAEMAAEDLAFISNQISEIEVENIQKLSGRQIILSMVAFSKGSNMPKTILEDERKQLVLILNELWYSVDVLQENVYILLRLVQETRDIIRTCYVYVDIFYKWNMPCYDGFISKKRRKRPSVMNVIHKFAPKTMRSKRLSDETSIISLMDFSSSIYQGVVQEIPVQFDGMVLLLRTKELDWVDEPLGLVSGIIDTRRKSTTASTIVTSDRVNKVNK